MKCAFLQGDLDERHEDDNDEHACKLESAQPVSDTFCEPFPELSRKLQLEHHQCARLLKAVYGLVKAPRRWCHRVATDLRNMRGEGSLMEPCLWTFRDQNGVIRALCLEDVDEFMLACSDSPFGKHVFDSINNLYEWRTWESRVFAQCGARITQANDKHTRTWGGFEISFAEYAKEISIITLPSHRRRDRKSQITSLELPHTSSLERSVALVGCAMFDTVAGASVVVDGRNTASHSGHDLLGEQAGWDGDCVGQNATQSPCSSLSCCGYVRRCWVDHSTRRHFARVTAGLHCKLRVVGCKAKKRICL